jgi:hypothetical protein
MAAMEMNREKKLCASCQTKAELFCTKCKVTPYCSIDCQKKSWSRHKTVCKLNEATPSTDSVTNIQDNEDFDVLYPYILINGSASTKENLSDTLNRITGLHGFDPDSNFLDWKGYEKSIVIGYSNEDQYVYRGYWDVNSSKRSDLLENNLATQLLMFPDCHGSFVIYKTENVLEDNDKVIDAENINDKDSIDTDQLQNLNENDMNNLEVIPKNSSSNKELDVISVKNILLTRREIWEIIEYRYLCSVEGVVTDRIHRVNMQRKEGLETLNRTNFTVI